VRVALVCDAYYPRAGGFALRLRELALALRACDIDAEVVAAKGDADDEVPIHHVTSSFIPGRLTELSALFRSNRFDVVHAHALGFSTLAFAAAVAGARTGSSSVLTFQTMLDRTSTLLGASEALLGWTRDIVLTAVSSVIATQAARALSGASVGVLPPGIDMRFWRDSPLRVRGAEMHFVSVLEPDSEHGAESLVRAFAGAVRFVAGTPKLHLTVVGGGVHSANVNRLAAELDIASRVSVMARIDQRERRALYASADAFVLPGAREAFGLAALEARTTGLPVVAMMSSGARDFITPGVNGLLARDESEMARFISRLAVEDALRRFISNRNRMDSPHHDWSTVVAIHRQIYGAAAALRDAPAPTTHA
jgi:glycogen(starch) synthase